jgi:hypothetical protein
MAFQKGQSGNPGGRPKKVREVMELAQDESVESIRALVRIRDECDDPRAVVAAANAILDRGLGKPMQPSEAKVDVVHHNAKEMTRERLLAIAAGEERGAETEH